MERIRVHRDGMKDLVFEGELLGAASNRYIGGQSQTTWFELELYKTKGGKYVLYEGFKTCWQGEADTHSAKVYENVDALRDGFLEEMSNLEYSLFSEACEKDPSLEDIRDDVII